MRPRPRLSYLRRKKLRGADADRTGAVPTRPFGSRIAKAGLATTHPGGTDDHEALLDARRHRLEAFAEHGRPRDALDGSKEGAERTLAELRDAGIALDDVTERLLTDGIEAFEVAMAKLLDGIERRRG